MIPRDRELPAAQVEDDETDLIWRNRPEPLGNDQVASQSSVGQYRSNDEWIANLRGRSDFDAQQLAHSDLSNYLYVVILNYLQSRRNGLVGLASYTDDEIITLAQDFVQSFMEKMVKNDYALLDKYSNVGRFTSWAAQVVLNLCATEFRRACWSRQELLGQHPYWDTNALLPETAVARSQLVDALESCLDKLPSHYREALVRCIAEGERASTVAEDLNMSANAVYILVHRAKNAMRGHLTHAGIEPQTISVFGE